MNPLFPIFLKLKDRHALVVGGGSMAAQRVKQLLAAGARVTVIAPAVNAVLDDLAELGKIAVYQRPFEINDVTRDYFIVIAATNDPDAQKVLAEQADRLGVLLNVVDDTERSNFYTPAVVERGDLKIAISTNGSSPVLARRLRQDLEAALPESTGEWIQELGELRKKLKIEIPSDSERRRQIMEEVIERTLRR